MVRVHVPSASPGPGMSDGCIADELSVGEKRMDLTAVHLMTRGYPGVGKLVGVRRYALVERIELGRG